MLPRAFLPEQDPLEALSKPFSEWEELATHLPKLLVSNQFHQRLEAIKTPLDAKQLETPAELERAMQILSYLGHAYVWTLKPTPTILPKVFAKSWYEVAKLLSRPPVLSYASYALHNWKRIDPHGQVALGNIALIQNFLGGVDEEWFILVHVEIEARAISAMHASLDAVLASESAALYASLKSVETSLTAMCETLDRMPERCDPYIYYNRVRPYLHGWKGHPSFTDGLIYDGVEEYEQKPQKFRGETGAQSSIIPTLDGLLGITHTHDELYHYLQEMRDYMPLAHREFIRYVETTSHVRSFIQKEMHTHSELREVYNRIVRLIERFRQTHLGFAAAYIQKQHEKSTGNPHAVGTGGTPFMTYLQKHKSETGKFLI